MSPSTVALAILLLGVLALIGILVRVRSRTAQNLFLPVSLIAGFIALIAGPQILGRIAGWLGWDPLVDGGIFGADVLAVWSELPGLLISVVFAALFLGTPIPSPRRAVTLPKAGRDTFGPATFARSNLRGRPIRHRHFIGRPHSCARV